MSPRTPRLLSGAALLSAAACSLLVDSPSIDGGEPVRPSIDGGDGGESGAGTGSGGACLGACGGGQGLASGTGGGGGELGAGGDPFVPSEDCLAPCDCDDDEHRSKGACGGDDCDDHDASVHPGQGLYFAVASENPNVGFDFDCSGELERDPEQGNAISCLDLALLDCHDMQGFHGTRPSCGDPGEWGTCEGVATLCSKVVLDDDALARCH